MSVLQFKRPEPPEETEWTVSGKAVCLGCRARVDRHLLHPEREISTCPSCNLLRGTWAFPVEPAEGAVWTCNRCSAQHFFYLQTGWLLCAGCGFYHRPWE